MPRKGRQPNRPETAREGYVYLVRHTTSKIHKIGITLNWERRARQLEVGDGVEEVLVSKVLYPGRIEQKLHKEFDLQRIPQSEWFNLTDTQVELVKSHFRVAEEALQNEKKKEADRLRELAQERGRSTEAKEPVQPEKNATQQSRQPQPYRHVPPSSEKPENPGSGRVSQVPYKPSNYQPQRPSYSVPPSRDRVQTGEWSSNWVKTDPFSLGVSYLLLIFPSLLIAILCFAGAAATFPGGSPFALIGIGLAWFAGRSHRLVISEIKRRKTSALTSKNVPRLTNAQLEEQRRRVFGKRR